MQNSHIVIAIMWCVFLTVITTLTLTSLFVEKLPWNPPYFPAKLNLTRKYIKDSENLRDFWQEYYCNVSSCREKSHTMCKYKVNLLQLMYLFVSAIN